MTEIHAMRRVDWWQIVCDLERKGYTQARISTTIVVPRSTVAGWKNVDAEPRHEDGERLLRMWCLVHSRPRDAVPVKAK